jgi:hypothetical protein
LLRFGCTDQQKSQAGYWYTHGKRRSWTLCCLWSAQRRPHQVCGLDTRS